MILDPKRLDEIEKMHYAHGMTVAEKNELVRLARVALDQRQWRPMKEAPKNTLGVAIHAQMTCCGGGGRCVLIAARQEGQWIIPSEHSFDLIEWAPLPELPSPLAETHIH